MHAAIFHLLGWDRFVENPNNLKRFYHFSRFSRARRIFLQVRNDIAFLGEDSSIMSSYFM